MKSIDDISDELKTSLLEDIIDYETQQRNKGNDYISHMMYLILDSKINYIKTKFHITYKDVELYKGDLNGKY